MIKRLWNIGDLHAGVHSNSNEWFQNMKSYFKEWLIPMLKKYGEDGDILVFTGDINDNNQIVRTEISNSLIDIFTELADIMPVYSIIGNHDIVKKYTNEINSVRPLGMIPNVEIISSPKEIEVFGSEKILFLPWCHSVEDEAREIKQTESQYLISHAHYMGMVFSDEYVYKSKDGSVISNPIKILDKFKRVWNGHIHKPEVFGSNNHIRNTGIPYNMKWTDYGNKCGIVLFDFEKQTEKFIENNYSPDFKYFNLIPFLDMEVDTINKEINNNYVKVLYPSDMRRLLDLEVIHDFLDGYKSLEFVPTTEKVKDQTIFEQMESFDSNKMLDVQNVIPAYVEALPEEDTIKNRLRKDLNTLYIKSQEGKNPVEL